MAVFVYNEGLKIKHTLSRFPPVPPYDVVIMDDGSTDDSVQYLRESNYPILRHQTNRGVGNSIKTVVGYARENKYDILVLMAGNGKMQSSEIPALVEPIINEDYDYVQGSRYLKTGRKENLPLFRDVMIKLFTFIVSIFTGYKGTDVTCGFRAYKLSILEDPRINIWQDWLNKYEMEYYIHYKVLTLGYRIKEVPISMIYPQQKRGYSKIKPFLGWWSMVKPWILLTLRIKK